MSDKKPIIKFLFYETKEAYFGVSADERKQLAIKTTKDFVDVGGRWHPPVPAAGKVAIW